MPKRKHSDLEHDLPMDKDERVNQAKAARLRHKFERGSQLLFRALKTARGFERQKLGRRQKTANKDGEAKTLERLEKEVQVLKGLNLEETATRYLLKQLKKTKRISESPEFIQLEKSIDASSDGPRDPAEANVTARLFKSNPIQSALPEILTDIRSLLGVDKDNNNTKKQRQTQTNKETVDDDQDSEETHAPGNKLDSAIDDKSRIDHGESGDAIMNDVSDDQSLDLSQFDARLASASDDDSGREEEDFSSSLIKAKYKMADDLSISSSASVSEDLESISEDSSESPPPPSSSQLKDRKKERGSDEPTSSKDTAFLPSLMMGGYWSGSESGEDNDDDEIALNAAGKPQRKNRMGQQARRALWEKKYGSGAKHLKDQNDKKKNNKHNNNKGNNKNSGWDSRRGATDDNDNKPRWATTTTKRTAAADGGQRSTKRKHENDGDSKPNKPSAPAALHPSWEAARKAKQQKAQASFQGTKVTFD